MGTLPDMFQYDPTKPANFFKDQTAWHYLRTAIFSGPMMTVSTKATSISGQGDALEGLWRMKIHIPGDLKRNNGFVATQHGFAARMKLQKPWGNVAAIFSLSWTENA